MYMRNGLPTHEPTQKSHYANTNVIGNRADVFRFNISFEKIKIKKAHALRFFQNRLDEILFHYPLS